MKNILSLSLVMLFAVTAVFAKFDLGKATKGLRGKTAAVKNYQNQKKQLEKKFAGKDKVLKGWIAKRNEAEQKAKKAKGKEKSRYLKEKKAYDSKINKKLAAKDKNFGKLQAMQNSLGKSKKMFKFGK